MKIGLLFNIFEQKTNAIFTKAVLKKMTGALPFENICFIKMQ